MQQGKLEPSSRDVFVVWLASPPLSLMLVYCHRSSDRTTEPTATTYRVFMRLAKRHPIWVDQTEKGIHPPEDTVHFRVQSCVNLLRERFLSPPAGCQPSIFVEDTRTALCVSLHGRLRLGHIPSSVRTCNGLC